MRSTRERLLANGNAAGNGNTAYVVATSHIDTQWRWTVQDVIRCYVPSTIDQNIALIDDDDYPAYVFSFEGAFRYMLAKEYFPELYATLKEKIAEDRWRVAGGALVAGDVNIPSPESLIRQLLYGNGFFKSEFGKTSKDVFLPDCFGFSYPLPSIAAHCGRLGFSTQKLTWSDKDDNFVPFDVGVWIGPDGASIVAALQPGHYNGQVPTNGPLQSYPGDWPYPNGYYAEVLADKIRKIGDETGLYAAYTYYGTGDQGGAPEEYSVENVQKSTAVLDPYSVRNTGSDQYFRDMSADQIEEMKERRSYQGELLMSVVGTGCFTSETAMKRWERENEVLAAATEAAAVAADWLGGAAYPGEALRDAWQRFLWHQFHDDLPGDSMPDIYLISWNDEVLALNRFASVLADAVGAIARGLDTTHADYALIVYNPLSIAREDVVRAEMTFPGGTPAAVRVYDGSGTQVPSQAVPGSAFGTLEVSFLASVPPISFTVFQVRIVSSPSDLSTGVTIDLRTLTMRSDRYVVTLDPGGDIRSIKDRQNGDRELVASGRTLSWQMLYNGGPGDPHQITKNNWPPWQIMPYDVAGLPRSTVGGPATITVYENGPVSVAFQVTRQQEGSTFTQIVRLYARGFAGRSVEVESRVDWQTDVTLLKASFPLSVSNPEATYDLGLGTIRRGNNDITSQIPQYEVPAQQWADLTDGSGDYGVAILNDCKYGWDKPADDTLRLTLIHTPYAGYGYYGSPDGQFYDAQRDFGPNVFRYAVCGHAGDWAEGDVPWTAAAFNQRLVAFQHVSDSQEGPFGRSFQFLSIDNPQVAVRALKKAEVWGGTPSNEVILRLQELTGRSTGPVRISLGLGIAAAREVNGEEDTLGPAEIENGGLVTSLSAYQPRTFALTLAPPKSPLALPSSTPVDIGYNVNVVAPDGSFNSSKTAFPAEQYPASVTWSSIRFDLTPKGIYNARRCDGVPISLPSGSANRVYLLAASTNGKKTPTFFVDGQPVTVVIQAITGTIGQWYDSGKRWMPLVGQTESCVEGTKNYGNNPTQVAPTPPRIERAPVAWYSTHLYQPGVVLRPVIPPCYYPTSDYTEDVLPYEFGYMFLSSIPLTGTGPHTLTPPNDGDILLFAVSVADNPNATTVPAGVLYD